MANYSCRLYLNTGFNAVNIPDSPALLSQCTYVDVNGFDIMQDRFLDKIRVRAQWNTVKDTDYAVLYSSEAQYYFIQGIKMLASDVAELTVLYDFVTSAGGVASIQYLDGVTSRVHVTDDTFGKYVEDDPLLAPAQPLEIQTNWFNGGTDTHTYVESTINLPQTGASKEGKSYTDGNGNTVIIPTVKDLDSFTEYKLANHSATGQPPTMLYDLNDTTPASGTGGIGNREAILKGCSRARELGIEQGAIVNEVQIPLVYAETTRHTESTVEVDSDIVGDTITIVQRVLDRKILQFTGKSGFVPSNINYKYTGAINNRLNYGRYTPYGLVSCSGESCEYNAEDIYDSDNQTAPVVKYVADPHTDGKPYFRWRAVNNDKSEIGFFKNCISGLQWKQIPLYFQSPSGTALNTMRYKNSREIASTNLQNKIDLTDLTYDAAMVHELAKGGTAAFQWGYGDMSKAGDVLSSAGAMYYATEFYNTNMQNMVRSYVAQKKAEMSDYIVQNTVSAPTVMFPYNSEMMRDFFGNGVMMYRYKYSQQDIRRIDKLLTMYGYRHTKALETSDFTNRTNFNYVECSNVSVTGHSRIMNEGIAMMLKNGIRVWHVLPSVAYYNTENPVR